MIKIQGLTKTFGSNKVLYSLELSVAQGEFIVLRGPNGCGKSTLFRCLLGLIAYDGMIAVAGHSPIAEGKLVREHVGFMPQLCGLHSDLSVAETLEFYSLLRNVSIDAANQLLNKLRLGDVRHLKVGELSGGMRQRLSFVVAAFARPSVLVLDEPIANLDRESQTIILSHLVELREDKTTILFSTHIGHDTLRIADREVLLEYGKLWDSEPLRSLERNPA